MQNLKNRFLKRKWKDKYCFSSSTLPWRTEFFSRMKEPRISCGRFSQLSQQITPPSFFLFLFLFTLAQEGLYPSSSCSSQIRHIRLMDENKLGGNCFRGVSSTVNSSRFKIHTLRSTELQALCLAPSQTNLVPVGDVIACCTHGASAIFSTHIDLAHPADGDAWIWTHGVFWKWPHSTQHPLWCAHPFAHKLVCHRAFLRGISCHARFRLHDLPH